METVGDNPSPGAREPGLRQRDRECAALLHVSVFLGNRQIAQEYGLQLIE